MLAELHLEINECDFLTHKTPIVRLNPQTASLKHVELGLNGSHLVNLATNETCEITFAMLAPVKVKLIGGGQFTSSGQDLCDGLLLGWSSV
jgi:hypothetical protein